MGNVSAPSCASRTCVGHPQHRGHPRLSDPQQLEGKSPRAPKGDFTSLCFMGHRGTTEPFVSWGRGRSPAVRPWGHPPLCPARPGPRSPARTLTRTWPSLSCVTITAESLSFSSKWTWPGFPSLGWLGAKRTAPAFALLPAWGWENSSSSSTPISHPHTPMGMNGTEDPLHPHRHEWHRRPPLHPHGHEWHRAPPPGSAQGRTKARSPRLLPRCCSIGMQCTPPLRGVPKGHSRAHTPIVPTRDGAPPAKPPPWCGCRPIWQQAVSRLPPA